MPDESDQRHFHSPRGLNRRPRYAANLTLPQIGALASALVIGGGLWWLLGVLPFFTGTSLVMIAVRVLGPGAVAGVLAVLFYALADDMREPVVRQLVVFSLRRLLHRHTYQKEVSGGPIPTAGRSRSLGRELRAAGRAGGVRARAGVDAARGAATRTVAAFTAAVPGVGRRAGRGDE
jgi:hypothetical protein